MPIPSPFHPRTSELCTSMAWKDWSGYYAVCSYGSCHEREYYAFRHAAGLIDVTPLFKYEVYGKDAARFLARIMAKDIEKLSVGQVAYCCWCDDDGKVVDDGTVWRIDDEYFRVTAAEPTLIWLHRYQRHYDVTIEDSTEKIGAVALQGPTSRDILKACSSDTDLDTLGFFRLARAKVGGVDAVITRTGYTGDLGYEVWVESKDAVPLWDALMETGQSYGIHPAGLDALDVTRVEAGFIMNGVDYYSANHCLIESRKSTPYELGLGWSVNLNRAPFNGQAALLREKEAGPNWSFVGLVLDWPEYEALFAAHKLPPGVPSGAWRTPVPVYDESGHNLSQVGYASSGAWSPLLKENLALATVQTRYAAPGTRLKMEVTVEFERKTVTATVRKTPFFDPKRKRA